MTGPCPVASDDGGDQQRRWLEGIQTALERTGAHGMEAARFLREHRTRIGVRQQSAGRAGPSTAGLRLIPDTCRMAASPPTPSALSSTRSVTFGRGRSRRFRSMANLGPGESSSAICGSSGVPAPGSAHQKELIDELLALPHGWNRIGLSAARRLMREYAGKAYRIDLLPLYPIQYELAYALTGRAPRKA